MMCVMTQPSRGHATRQHATPPLTSPHPTTLDYYTPLVQLEHLDIKVGEFVIIKPLRETRSESTPVFIMEVMADTVPPTLRGSIQVHSSLIRTMPKTISVTGFASRLKYNTPEGAKYMVPIPYSAWSCTPAHVFLTTAHQPPLTPLTQPPLQGAHISGGTGT